ncbi:MAG: phosphomannomutase/phosphoglucomutase [Candidatus Woesearchaeota archaeon]
MSIFKTYDIRGIYPEELNEENSYLIAKLFLQYANENFDSEEFYIGHDARTSSPKIHEAIIKGLLDSGASVNDVGLSTTPLLNFCVAYYNKNPGIMVTASHNPKEYNGIKLIGPHALQLYYEKGIKNIELLFNQKIFDFKLFKKPELKNIHETALNDYINHLMKFSEIKNFDKKFAVDFMSGCGSITALPLFEKLSLKPILLNETPDGNFPKHQPDPMKKENLEELKKTIIENNLDFGVTFDGDADRVVILDENGNIIPSDILFGLLCSYELENSSEKTIYVDPRFSMGVIEELTEKGANIVTLKVGNPFYKEALYNDDFSLMAGEFSGHLMFKQNYGIDDGLFSFLKFLNIISKTQKPVSEIFKPFQKYQRSEEINLKVTEMDKTLIELEEFYSNAKISKIDGLKIVFDDWWAIIRKSNTEPLLRVLIEAKNKELLEKKQEEIINKINSLDKKFSKK